MFLKSNKYALINEIVSQPMHRSISSKEAKCHDVNFVIAAGALITNLITLKSRNSITALFQRAVLAVSGSEPQKYYVTPPRNREKFREQWRRQRAK